MAMGGSGREVMQEGNPGKVVQKVGKSWKEVKVAPEGHKKEDAPARGSMPNIDKALKDAGAN